MNLPPGHFDIGDARPVPDVDQKPGDTWIRATLGEIHGTVVRRETVKQLCEMLERTTDETQERSIQTLLNAELQKQKHAGEEPTRVLSTPVG